MKKKMLFMLALSMCIALAGGSSFSVSAATTGKVAINKKNFPDKTFRGYIREEFDKNKDGKLSQREINKATNLCIFYQLHARLEKLDCKGIEYFTKLRDVNICGVETVSINVSKNKKLENISIYATTIKGLNVKGNKRLESLGISGGSNMKKLDLSANKNLKEIDCAYARNLKTIVFPEDSKLEWVDVAVTAITKLKIKNAKGLKQLHCAENKLSSIELVNTPSLIDLECNTNRLKKLDVSTCKNLKYLVCSNNQIKKLSLYQNKKLNLLDCTANLITNLDISKCPKLTAERLTCDPTVQVIRG